MINYPTPEADLLKSIPLFQASLRDVMSISANASTSVVVLDKGGLVPIENSGSLTLGLGWDPVEGEANVDLDAGVAVLDAENIYIDFVYGSARGGAYRSSWRAKRAQKTEVEGAALPLALLCVRLAASEASTKEGGRGRDAAASSCWRGERSEASEASTKEKGRGRDAAASSILRPPRSERSELKRRRSRARRCR